MHNLAALNRAKQSGFAMIEVLVTAIIVAIGVSGIGILLLTAIQGTQDNAQQSQGMWVVQDLVGRMRSNPEGAKALRYETDGVSCAATAPTVCADSVGMTYTPPITLCSAAEMAAHDLRVTMCGSDTPDPDDPSSKIFDSPAEFFANPVLVSDCTIANTDNTICQQYKVELTWDTRITQGGETEAARVNTNSYSMVLELN